MLGSANLGPSILCCNWWRLSRTNTFKATDFKFNRHVPRKSLDMTSQNFSKRGRGQGQVTPVNFWALNANSSTAKDTDFKFGKHIPWDSPDMSPTNLSKMGVAIVMWPLKFWALFFNCFIMPNRHRRRRGDETVLSPRRRRCEHNSQLAHDDCRRIRSTIRKLTKQTSCLTTWILMDIDSFFNNDDIMTSLLNKLSISIKIGVIKRYRVCLVSFQTVDRIRRQSSWASCELCSHRRRQSDKTVSSRRRCVLGITVKGTHF